MKKSKGNGNIIARYLIIAAAFLLVSAGMVYKLFYNTVIEAPNYNKRAKEEFQRVKEEQAERGNILARDGTILATNMMVYDLVIDYRDVQDDEKFVRELPKFVDRLVQTFPESGTREHWMDTLTQPLKISDRKMRPYYFKVISGMNYSQYLTVEKFPLYHCTKDSAFRYRSRAGMKKMVARAVRVRPCGEMARRSIGAVGMEKESGDRVFGKWGLEAALDSLLRGKPGKSRPQLFTKGSNDWVIEPPVRGYDVKTTIDVTLQDLLDNTMLDIMKSDRMPSKPAMACAILMEVKTGDILAISNFDNKNGEFIEAMNYCFESRYESGSTLKPITLMIMLEDGIVKDVESLRDIRTIKVPGRVKPIARHYMHTDYASSIDIIKKSENSGMVRMVFDPKSPYPENPPLYRKRYEDMGFFEPMNIGIGNAVLPYIPKNFKRDMLAQMSYGYGIAFTPISLISLYNAIANDGKYVRPRLYTELISPDTVIENPVSYIRERICTEDHARQVRKCLRAVVTEGTASFGMKQFKIPIAGKTGTAFAETQAGKGYSGSNQRLSFCGMFPYENPQYTMLVIFDNVLARSVSPGRSCGVVIGEMAEKMYARGYLGGLEIEEDEKKKDDKAHIFRTADAKTYESVTDITGIICPKAMPDTLRRGLVPNVVSMGLREAIKRVELCGYNVKTVGTGYVVSQSPAPGQRAERGTTITLTLN